ncbi:MAG: M13 family peptidase [Acidobacteria bacterium]|nr:MAG: M13 family peptidase [Acidobacteriota bacterium]
MLRTSRLLVSAATLLGLAAVTSAAADVPPKPRTSPSPTAARPATPAPARAATAATAPKRPLTTLPYTPSLDLAAMDRSVDPCVDFFSYSCGGWKRRNPIPPDQARWDVYGKLTEDNAQFLWGMLEESGKPSPTRDAATQKIGDYFAACMEEAAVEKAGATPLKSDLDAIAALSAKDALGGLLGRLHLTVDSSAMLFGFGSEQDFKDSSRVIGFATAGGLGLPDRDYYVKDDAKSQETRQRYVQHVEKMLRLLGEAPEAAARDGATVMRVETALAKASLTRVDKRDPYKIYHRLHRAELQALTPSFRWADYLRASGQPDLDDINVTEPDFYKEMEARLKGESLGDLQTYLRWHLVHNRARYLSRPFVDENFAFYSAYLRDVKEQQPRWKRCVQWVDRDLGEALGQVFVRKAFPPELKASTSEMVRQIETAMEQRLKDLPWMGAATKGQALSKLHAMNNKIGYPDRWRDYTSLDIRRGGFAGNVERAVEFESRRQLAKIGKPVDRGEWGMTPPTVNAYYNPLMNDMNFPAGVLLPPLYDPKLDAAPNYGNTGSTIGHELTHGFDDEGRQFDDKGNLRDWWTPQDAAEFEKRAACVSDQYGQYTVVDDIKLNSKLTLGEDVADLGGTLIALQAWRNAVAGKALANRDGFTPDQRFFIGFAQWACGDERPASKRVNAVTNPHSPLEYRINGVVVNVPDFAAAFSCRPGQPMVKEADKVCRIW